MTFDANQVQALSGKLSARHVKHRQAASGMTLAYVEGWHAIAEANRIFGYDAWDRQTMTLKCVWEGRKGNLEACSYIARVRIKVRAGESVICREGCGSGHGSGPSRGEAHESAIKEAETDAMKRALATFGNPFGLALYDRERRGVTGKKRKTPAPANGKAITWIVLKANGQVHSTNDVPVGFCSQLRELLEKAPTREELKILWERNWATLKMLKENLPNLMSDRYQHYSDLLILVYRRRLKDFEDAEKPAPKPKTNGSSEERPGPSREDNPSAVRDQQGAHKEGRIDKSALALGSPIRRRDKEHRRYVASLPCLVCGQSPCQAHHISFAQPRALGRKVSDEWTVPLCVKHHAELHRAGVEREWWREREIDPSRQAAQLWADSQGVEINFPEKRERAN
jgi:DNA recombination protein Rad52